jgi:hypothetical protein
VSITSATSEISDNAVAVQENEETSTIEYNLNDIPEYQELLNKYSVLEEQVTNL